MSGHATYFSIVFSSLSCVLIAVLGQHLASAAPDAPKLPQHLNKKSDSCQAVEELPAHEQIQNTSKSLQ